MLSREERDAGTGDDRRSPLFIPVIFLGTLPSGEMSRRPTVATATLAIAIPAPRWIVNSELLKGIAFRLVKSARPVCVSVCFIH
jgi:hypothetical protein